MFSHLTTTHSLALLIGLYFLAAGIGLVLDRTAVPTMMKDLSFQPILGYLGGVIAFVIGGAILAVHNQWDGLLSSFITLVGWMALAEGVLMLAFRKWFLDFFARLNISESLARIFGVGTAVVGAVLIVAGLGG